MSSHPKAKESASPHEAMKNLKINNKKKQEEPEEDEDEDEDEEGDEEDDEDEEEVELSPEVSKRLVALRKLHDDVEVIDVEYKAERILLELKYKQKRNVLYETRKNLVTGVIDAEDNDATVVDVDEEKEKGVPNFWLQVFGNHPVVAEIICEHDIPALAFLDDIRCDYNQNYTTFTLSFEFRENPFFTNKIMTKVYTLEPDLLDEKNPSLSSSEGTVIEWKAGKNLCVAEVKKKQKAKSGKNKGQIRTIIKEIPRPSFFHYFSDPKEDEDDEEEEEEEEEKERIELTEEDDFEIAHAIRTALIPDAVLWFTGEAHADEYGDEDEEDDEDGGDDDDDDEDDEDDDDDDEDGSPPKKNPSGGKGGKNGGGIAKTSAGGFANTAAPGGAAAGGEQPECKQN